MNEEIRKAIIAMLTGLIPLNSTWCKVLSVTNQKCKVEIDGLEIDDILLGFDKSGLIVYPKINTDVLVAFIDNSKTNGAVIYAEQTEKIEIMGTANGGLGLTEKIAERLKRLEDAYEKLQSSFNSHLNLYNLHVHSGGTISGSTGTTTPDVANTTNESVSPRTTQNYISSNKISHGNG